MKYTLQEARNILGVTESSSKDDIEKKYDVIMKKYRVLKSNGTLDIKAEEDFVKSTEAYRILMGYEVNEPKIEKQETYVDKAFVKAGVDRKKAENFFYYHKYYILAGILAIIFIAFTVRSIVTRVEPDITIGFMGEVHHEATDKLKAKIEESIPEIKEVGFDSATLTNNYKSQDAYANLSKAMVLLSVADIDIFLVSKYVYDSYAHEGPFMALEDFAKELDIDVSKSEYLKLRVVDKWDEPQDFDGERKPKTYVDAEPRLYGIDVTNNEFFKEINVVGPEKILVVRAVTNKRNLVLKLIKLFTK